MKKWQYSLAAVLWLSVVSASPLLANADMNVCAAHVWF